MKLFLVLLFAVSLFAKDFNFTEDPLLKAPFEIYPYNAGAFNATLIRLPFLADSTKPKAAILYIHGFNDYFFQKELAEYLTESGYAFYAIDLHKYGRSYKPGETMGELRDIQEYYGELDSAVKFIKELENTPLVILGHSTGGLIATLYAADRKNVASAIVLNSPFLEMNYPWLVRKFGAGALAFLGEILPDVKLPRSKNDNYDRSLLKSKEGFWEYDTTLKKVGSLPVDFGWIRAIHLGHVKIQSGLKISQPILVMHSSCSYKEKEWSEEYTHCDGVLDVEHIRNYGAFLGPSVQLEEIEGGLHDLYLSAPLARKKAYEKTVEFLNQLF